METDPTILNTLDPITIKMRDTAALEKLMQQAVTEAVEKARKLGFLPPAANDTDANVGPISEA